MPTQPKTNDTKLLEKVLSKAVIEIRYIKPEISAEQREKVDTIIETSLKRIELEARASQKAEDIAKLEKFSETMELWQEAYGLTDVSMIIVRTTLERAIAKLKAKGVVPDNYVGIQDAIALLEKMIP